MSFPFSRLSTELVLEVISFAASPEVDCVTSIYGRRGTYDNALALSLVSYDFRRAAMPHLLRTVVLRTSRDVHLFIQALLRQCWFCRHFPHLVLDYKHYVCRLWCTESTNTLYDGHDFETTLGWDLFYDLLFNVRSLGLGIHSFDLLLDGLAMKHSTTYSPTLSKSMQSKATKSCSRITFAGSFFPWGSVTSKMQGIQFLAGITHLTLWITDTTIPLPSHSRIPTWVNSIPFQHLTSLEYLEVLLIPDLSEEEVDQVGYYGEYYSPHPMEVLVLTHPPTRSFGGAEREKGISRISQHDITVAVGIEERLRDPNPFAYGSVCPLYGIPRTASASSQVASCWEAYFLEGRSSRTRRSDGLDR
ncbi:hypothetical protein NP233_g1344 [Leucocoprinus birnbaumii]|uniref:Uncharacterized protein n=1 Tax=Leucocoprinus birnbaumii TaxID=56174 RepID=A0AAD5W068_9AGAR|nr:hypothetical protein NP233_g1344 [Leucocoprinus birnbaumii]